MAEREFALRSEVTGRLITLGPDIGGRFRKGDLLTVLDASDANLDLKIVQAEVESATKAAGRARLRGNQALAALARQEKLLKAGVLKPSALEEAQFAIKLAEMDLRAAEQAQDISRLKLEQKQQAVNRFKLFAPFDGVVAEKSAQPGDIVVGVADSGGRAETGLMTLIDLASLVIEADVTETSISRLTDGQPAVVIADAYPKEKFKARIFAIVPKVSAQKGTVTVRLKPEEALSGQLIANMSVKVEFEAADKPVASIEKGSPDDTR